MKVISIIVTYNGAAYIEKCIQSLLATANFEHKIIVVDNNSRDETLAIVARFPTVSSYKSESNLGFGQANNIGLKIGLEWGADYFFLLNQDAWIEADSLSKLLVAATKNTDFGIISPMHWNGAKSGFDFGFAQHISREGELSKILFDCGKAGAKEIYPVSFVNAAAWLISRPCVQKVGGFAPIFFHYGEDDNYVHRVLFHGFGIGVHTDSVICHDRKAASIIVPNPDVEFRMYLIRATNLSEDFQKVKSIYLNEWLSSIVKNLMRLNVKNLLHYGKLIGRAQGLTKNIKLTRKITTKGSCYL